jgi:hypothetical protein
MFLSPDPYLQAPGDWLNYNRYSYALNNPFKYTDPSGEFIFSAFLGPVGVVLDGMCWGAVIGAGSSAVSYTIGAGISGNWSWSGLGGAMGMGAVGGAISGGIGAAGSIGAFGSFGNTLGYSILNQTSSSIVTNAIYGNDITWGSVAGNVVGALVSSALPNFNAIGGGALKNAIAEIGYNSIRGATTGLYSGITQSIIDKNPDAVWQNMIGGAVNGMSSTMLNIAAFGPAVNFDDSSVFGNEGIKPIYRSGGILSLFGVTGISWGRTAYANKNLYNDELSLNAAFIHEGTHWRQQQIYGFGNFYGKTVGNYARAIWNYGTTSVLYTGEYLPTNFEMVPTLNEYLYLRDNGRRYYLPSFFNIYK